MNGYRQVVAVALAIALIGGAAQAANLPSEPALIEVLNKGTKPEKAIACKQLAVVGSKASVPALAGMLNDPEMASWARIALEAIPGPEVDAALRDAAGKLQGKLLVGVINSIGVRKDALAVALLAPKLADADNDVSIAAAAALGHIGGDAAAAALTGGLAGATAEIRAAAGQGAVYCAEGFARAGNKDAAIKLYDALRKAEVPKQRVQEATRGAILARGEVDGLPILLEQLRSPDKAMLRVGLRVARELAGKQVQEAIIAELGKTTLDRQALLIAVLSDRGDVSALPAVLEKATAGPADVRLAAIEALERLGNVSVVPALLTAAVEKDATLATAARATLARLQGKEVEAALLGALQESSGQTRKVLVDLAAERRIEGSFPVIMKCAEDADPGVRASAIDTIGAMGEAAQAGDLAKLAQKTQDAQDRTNIEKSLNTLTGRVGAPATAFVIPLAKDNDPTLRIMGLHALKGCGGPEALAAVKGALDDKEAAVQDDAVRTLSTWPNRWPEDANVIEPLVSLAKSPKKEAHKVLALRGYMSYVAGNKKLPEAEKLSKIKDILPLATRPEEKKAVISSLRDMSSVGALDLLTGYVADASVSDEASSAIVNGKNFQKLPKAQKQKALQAVVAQCKNEAIKKRAQELLK